MRLRQKGNAWIWAFLALLVASAAPGNEIGAGAPAFTFVDLSGQSRSLSHYAGKVLILDFWATWCAPCRATIPELVNLQEKYSDKGLVILGLSVDDPQLVSDECVRAFVKKHKINYPVLRAGTRIIRDYFGEEPPLVPAAFLVDKDGRLAAKVSGYRPGALEEILRKILGKETPEKAHPLSNP